MQGVNITFNHKSSFFDHLQADEARAKRYDLSMRFHSRHEGFDLSHTVLGYPWASRGKATVVDVSFYLPYFYLFFIYSNMEHLC